MEQVVMIAIAMMIVAAVAIVAYPYFGPARDGLVRERAQDLTWENLVLQRDAAYAAIKDLEFDRAMGKLSESDYQSLRAKCETKAAAILQELDSLSAFSLEGRNSHPPDRDAMIEHQVQQLRHNGKRVLPRVSRGELTACPKCGKPCGAQDAFCASCGTALRGAVCPMCGTRAAAGDKFCAKCGARVGSPAALAG
jgi:hypothetical protein